MSFLLDTNAYFLLFQSPRPPSYSRLMQHLGVGGIVSFYISEITSLEIHSVLGKYRRGSPSQRQQCKRKIVAGNTVAQCSNTWIYYGVVQKQLRSLGRFLLGIPRKKLEVISEQLLWKKENETKSFP